MSSDVRIEQDSIGELTVPADAYYYGVHTARAMQTIWARGRYSG
jgi:aspartate ammonia-lyase